MNKLTDQALCVQLMNGCNAFDINLSKSQQSQFILLLHLLRKWDRVTNLTAIRQPAAIIDKHFVDSLAIAPYLEASRILDVGSGAGFPGLPLAIYAPDKHFTLLDSNHKKTRFIRQAAAELGLKNITCVQSRVQSYQPANVFPMITSRAFSSLQDMVKMTAHCRSEEGLWLAMKGEQPTSEIEALQSKEACLVTCHRLQVPGMHQRHLCVIRKINSG